MSHSLASPALRALTVADLLRVARVRPDLAKACKAEIDARKIDAEIDEAEAVAHARLP